MKPLFVSAAVCGLGLVIVGATAGHGPPADSPPDVILAGLKHASDLNTPLMFGFVHVLAALFAGTRPGRLAGASGWVFLAGVLLFSGVLCGRLLAPGGVFDQVIMAVPLGGLAFMAGWILLGAAEIFGRKA
ncbi:MAG TPA: DUF423 domain-containing protein [Hyphomonadaceae bacterium]|jgi:uncharacterized membrane protein YgdD (TMEM256/DUF423 family)|nr:DUF423 domain-containing protein [Hyphomonadaceae bacterium]